MGFKYIKKLPTQKELLREIPLPKHLDDIKKKRDIEIANIFKGEDDRFILIIGPCSAHDEDAVVEYVSRLARVQEKVKDQIMLIPRIYTNKPRTTGKGYKGMLHQPNPQKKPNMIQGIKSIRKMHIRAMSESYLSSADEMLYPENYPFVEDLLSYVAVGARSVENQGHRLTISGLDIPIGMKNPTSGDLSVMLNAIYAGQESHIFTYNNYEVQSSGNELTHGILRGAVDAFGNNITNYHYEKLIELKNKYNKYKLQNQSIIIDVNHSNSGKKFSEQPRIAREILYSRSYSPSLKKMIKGLMIESYLEEGRQDIDGEVFGKSITDPCLNWTDSEKLIFNIAEIL
ncbi:MAG: 3-deoxy-7-phosphoheptulonate synthase [Candidatus Marinimicrobia bacterium]|nr:3-deoxy-7-phosphoheptulonate synthase [Candidatus Neomarinimicrobiota bacterium]